MKCTEWHETDVFQFPPSTQRSAGRGPIYKMMQCQAQNASELSPTLSCLDLPNISFLYRSGHITQFLANKK